MNNLKNTWYNRKIVRFFFKKELKKKTSKQLNSIYVDLVKIKNCKSKTSYPMWQVNIAIDVVIKERVKRDKSK